jgi:hypothetical protein
MSSKKCTIIEIVADYIYFVMMGTHTEIEQYCKLLSKKTNNYSNDIKYISLRIDIPISFACEKLEKNYGKIFIETGTESAQSYAFAQDSYIIKNKNNSLDSMFNNKITHMLMIIEDVNGIKKLKFPKLELHDQDDPETVVLEWIKEMGGYIPKTVKKTIKPISIVGYNDDILVYSAKL